MHTGIIQFNKGDIKTFRDLFNAIERDGEMDNYVCGTFLSVKYTNTRQALISSWNISLHDISNDADQGGF